MIMGRIAFTKFNYIGNDNVASILNFSVRLGRQEKNSVNTSARNIRHTTVYINIMTNYALICLLK